MGQQAGRAVFAGAHRFESFAGTDSGGFTSIPGAIIGGLIIGAGEKVAEVFIGPLLGGAIEDWFAYMLALIFLVFVRKVYLAKRLLNGYKQP